jgi:hypothetical protein
MKNMKKICLGLFTGLLLTGCSKLDVTTDYDKTVIFSEYENYSFCVEDMEVTNEKHPDYDNAVNRSLIQTAMQKELEKIGFKNEEEDPELLAGFRIIIKDTSITFRSCTTRGEFTYWPECTFKTYNYTQGTLILYLTDSRKRQIIWQSTVNGVLDGQAGKMDKIIDQAVKEMFRDFPMNKEQVASKI